MKPTTYSPSYERGRRIGYFVNSLSKLKKDLESRDYKISQAQMRLIIKELQKISDFEKMDFKKQKEIYASIVGKYVNVAKATERVTWICLHIYFCR